MSNNSSIWSENVLTEGNHRAELTCFVILFLVAFVLNVTVLISTIKVNARNTSFKLLLNACVANLMGSFLLLFYGEGDTWLLRKSACVPLLTADMVWNTLSLLSTFVLCLECFVNTRKFYHSRRTPPHFNFKLTMALIWLASLLFAFLTFVLIEKRDNATLCYLYLYYSHELYAMYLSCVLAAPLLGVASMEVYLWRARVRYQCAVRSDSEDSFEEEGAVTQNNFAVFHLAHTLMLCWLPFVAFNAFLMAWRVTDIHFAETRYKILKAFTFLRGASCAVQPIIMLALLEEVNQAVRAIYSEIDKELYGEVDDQPSRRKKRLKRRVRPMTPMEESKDSKESQKKITPEVHIRTAKSTPEVRTAQTSRSDNTNHTLTPTTIEIS